MTQVTVGLMAKKVEMKLKVGDAAPEFSLPGSDGLQWTLSELRGKHVVLYFYPKDDTPGCTKEACGFRDLQAEYAEKGVVVLGASADSVKSHQKFVTKYTLPFPLLADVEKKLVQAYGVWGEKTFMGRKYEGIFRVTFHIGPDGRIEHVWPEVKPEVHAKEVLEAI